jgi:hypothetical protein
LVTHVANDASIRDAARRMKDRCRTSHQSDLDDAAGFLEQHALKEAP